MERLSKRHDKLRKDAGLPDPSYYEKMAAQKKKELEDMKKEDLDENMQHVSDEELDTIHKKLVDSGHTYRQKGGVHTYTKGDKTKRYSVKEEKELSETYKMIKEIMKKKASPKKDKPTKVISGGKTATGKPIPKVEFNPVIEPNKNPGNN